MVAAGVGAGVPVARDDTGGGMSTVSTEQHVTLVNYKQSRSIYINNVLIHH